MTRHTPGPWHVDGLTIEAADGNVALINLARENLADAHLIAAAPEMLEALHAARHALVSYECGNVSPDLAQTMNRAVEAAIAKAEGKP